MKLVVLGLVAMTGLAHAEDYAPAIHVGGIGQLDLEDRSDELAELRLDTHGSMRATIGWEPAPIPYPAERGYRVGGALVPELVAGAVMRDDRAEVLLGAGLRAELRILQRQGGWFRIDSRSALYVAARGMVVGRDRDVVLEGVLGDHFSFGDSPVRFGFEVGVTERRGDAMPDRPGLLVQLYLGYGAR